MYFNSKTGVALIESTTNISGNIESARNGEIFTTTSHKAAGSTVSKKSLLYSLAFIC